MVVVVVWEVVRFDWNGFQLQSLWLILNNGDECAVYMKKRLCYLTACVAQEPDFFERGEKYMISWSKFWIKILSLSLSLSLSTYFTSKSFDREENVTKYPFKREQNQAEPETASVYMLYAHREVFSHRSKLFPRKHSGERNGGFEMNGLTGTTRSLSLHVSWLFRRRSHIVQSRSRSYHEK